MARGSSYDDQARDMADRIEAARDAGRQLVLLEGMDAPDAGAAPTRGKGRAQSVLRDWLALRGMRMPEDVLADLAGLASSDDAFVTAMARAEQLVAWQFDGAMRTLPSGGEVEAKPTASARMEAFKLVFTAMLRSAEALAPYGLAKTTPDVAVQQNTTIVMPSAQGSGEGPKVISSRRTAPPPMPGETVEHQQVIGDDDA